MDPDPVITPSGLVDGHVFLLVDQLVSGLDGVDDHVLLIKQLASGLGGVDDRVFLLIRQPASGLDGVDDHVLLIELLASGLDGADDHVFLLVELLASGLDGNVSDEPVLRAGRRVSLPALLQPGHGHLLLLPGAPIGGDSPDR